MPESAPEAITGSPKCKNFLGGACPQIPRDCVLMYMENSLPLDLILTCCVPPWGSFLNEGLTWYIQWNVNFPTFLIHTHAHQKNVTSYILCDMGPMHICPSLYAKRNNYYLTCRNKLDAARDAKLHVVLSPDPPPRRKRIW